MVSCTPSCICIFIEYNHVFFERYHRRAVVERLGDPSAEFAFLGNVLLEDGKNYHAWSYRQWLLNTFGKSHGLWDGELDRLHNLLSIDHYNNSAWNQR